MADYPASPRPSFRSYSRDRVFKTQVSQMDSGVEQRRGKWSTGKRLYPMFYENLNGAEKDRIVGFYDSRQGPAEVFTFIPPHVRNRVAASRSFSAAEWTKNVNSVVYPDFQVAPNPDNLVGPLTAELVQRQSSANPPVKYVSQTVTTSIASSENWVLSVFARERTGGNTTIALQIVTSAESGSTTNKTISTSWDRVSIGFTTTTSATTITAKISPVSDVATAGRSNIWGVQLEKVEAPIPTDEPTGYEPTTSSAGARNVLKLSEQLNSAASWVNDANIVVTENEDTAPHELADLIDGEAGGGEEDVKQDIESTGEQITLSVFAKKHSNGDSLALFVTDKTTGVNLVTSLETITDSWVRYEVNVTNLTEGNTLTVGYEFRIGGGGDTRSLLWGAMFEYNKPTASPFLDDFESYTARFSEDEINVRQVFADTFSFNVSVIQVL